MATNLPIIFDVLDMALTIVTGVPYEKPPPPMTQQEVLAQKLYADDCLTTRDGIEMACQAAFEQDVKRGFEFDESKQ